MINTVLATGAAGIHPLADTCDLAPLAWTDVAMFALMVLAALGVMWMLLHYYRR
ncbi:hypothetical protein [Alloactinosynnema sp. L-07]|uniref:hypothetical protein n=1 Tax=Alloactinosynnema sp. L-07 TaxID=1653480 RepID=UPI00065F047A|nr:hypothetical protein [Alloactinosynnema sp. L-07]CRK56953.1 hypothetical protein [Alloactinosynnema sp. L-07]